MPIFKATKLHEEVSKNIKINKVTINRFINKLAKVGIIIPEEGKDRYVKYYFKALVDLIQ